MSSSIVTFRSLVFLGTSSGTPTAYRNVSSYALTLSDGAVWLVDAGEGTQHQLMKSANVSRGSIEKIFVTHLHGDHAFGLPGLMCSMSLTWSPPGVVPLRPRADQQQVRQKSDVDQREGGKDGEGGASEGPQGGCYDHFSKKTQFLELYGPQGLASYLRGALISSESRFPFQYRVTELIMDTACCSSSSVSSSNDGAPSAACAKPTIPTAAPSLFQAYINAMSSLRHPDEVDPIFLRPVEGAYPSNYHYNLGEHRTLSVRAAVLNHRVFCVGYVVTEADAPGTLLMEKVIALGVPKGPLLSKLKMGTPVTFSRTNDADGGREEEVVTVHPADVVGPSHAGRTAVLLGDTCDSTNIASLLSSLPSSSSSSSSHRRRRGVDWLVHESTFDAANEALAIPRGHSTARMAGAFAASIGARNLILTHFSARFPSSTKDPALLESIRMEAQVAANTAPLDDGSESSATVVHVADDFSVFDMERKKIAALQPPPLASAPISASV